MCNQMARWSMRESGGQGDVEVVINIQYQQLNYKRCFQKSDLQASNSKFVNLKTLKNFLFCTFAINRRSSKLTNQILVLYHFRKSPSYSGNAVCITHHQQAEKDILFLNIAPMFQFPCFIMKSNTMYLMINIKAIFASGEHFSSDWTLCCFWGWRWACI